MADDPVTLDRYHWHEALDRTLLFYEMIEAQLASHPVVESNPKFNNHVQAAMQHLMDAYIKIGSADPFPIIKD